MDFPAWPENNPLKVANEGVKIKTNADLFLRYQECYHEWMATWKSDQYSDMLGKGRKKRRDLLKNDSWTLHQDNVLVHNVIM